MRSLFLKIFFLYWLANLIMFATVFVIIRWTNVGANMRPPPLEMMDRALAEEAVDRLDVEGPEALAAHIAKLRDTIGVRLYVFDAQGREIAGQPVSAAVKEQDAASGIDVAGTDGAAYRAVVVPPQPPFWRRALPFLVLAIALGGVSYWLARHVAAPVQRLRAVSQQLGHGDLTARVGPAVSRRKDAIGGLGRDFDLMADRLHALVESHQRLLRDVSHELRSPLARLRVALGLAEAQAGPAAAEALQEIEGEAGRLNDLIGRLLTVSRLDAQSAAMERVPLDLAELVRRIAEDGDYEAQSQGCRTRVVRCDACTLGADADLLHSAIENVVRNAIRYTARGTEVEISLARVEGCAVVAVRDHGPGVPAEALADIFRPFYRLGDARDSASGGAGLGLAIAQRAVAVHDGTIWALAAPGGGLIVELRLPVGGPGAGVDALIASVRTADR
ncbi:MAG TPA: ATP-binding protein [Phycisphaerae bacterium]|mgnify:CR=1 FL=1|nr:HAMP domain-containing protein [Phycisphaerales bacterium]HRX84133.1 ATP-binding protein [Phycisphaerae bacterium]